MIDLSRYPWFKHRRYAHFDRPPSLEQTLAVVCSAARVAAHPFFPLILRPIKHKFLAVEDGKRRWKRKIRPVTYAAHMDAHIHAYYAWLIGAGLESWYASTDGSRVDECVIAYRKKTPPKNNVDFAGEVFHRIGGMGHCDVVCIDVEGFFDCLSHELLKVEWCAVLGLARLPADHYAVFRSMVRDHAVLWHDIRLALRQRYYRRAGSNGERLCSLEAFRKSIVPLVSRRSDLIWKVKRKSPPPDVNKDEAGIPQGSPLSAVLANLYMRPFDVDLHRCLNALFGDGNFLYRRYSDDILVVAPVGSAQQVHQVIYDCLKRRRLGISASKTEIASFRQIGGRQVCSVSVGGKSPTARPVQYLGLTFDGKNVRIRPGTVARIHHRMTSSIGSAFFAARSTNAKHTRPSGPHLHRRKLYARFSTLGYGWAYGNPANQRVSEGRLPRLGAVMYVARAKRKLRVMCLADSGTTRQLGQLRTLLSKRLDDADKGVP